jgi:hypothetical protein
MGMTNDWMFNLLPIVFILIGGVTLVKGILSFLRKRKLGEVGFTTTGTVTKVGWKSTGTRGGQVQHPTIRFVTNLGLTYEFTESEDVNSWTFYQVGQQLPVSYDPKNPQHAKIGTPASVASPFSLYSIVPVLGGAFFLIVGVNLLISSPFGSFSRGTGNPAPASSTPTPRKLITPVSSRLQIKDACTGHQDDWVWVEGYPGPGVDDPASQAHIKIDLHSQPDGGDTLSMWVSSYRVKPSSKGSPKEVRLLIKGGVVADSDTKVLVLGQVDSSNGRCELNNVSDVTRP